MGFLQKLVLWNNCYMFEAMGDWTPNEGNFEAVKMKC